MKPIYHGTIIQGLKVIKPFKRFTPGGPELADQIPPRIYATYNPAFAAAHSFPWSSDDGVDIVVEDGVVTVVVPHDKQQVLRQEICIYTLPDSSFVFTEEEEMGLTYHSTEEVASLSCKCFDSVKEAMSELGGNVKII